MALDEGSAPHRTRPPQATSASAEVAAVGVDRHARPAPPAPPAPSAPKAPSVGWRLRVRRLLELTALTGLAIAQPLLDTLAGAPEAFVFHEVTGATLVAFVAIVAFGPPLVLWCLELLAGIASERLVRIVHPVVLSALAGLFLYQLAAQLTSMASLVLVGAGIAGGVAFSQLYRLAAVRQWLAVLAVVPVLAAGVFLAGSPVLRMSGELAMDEVRGASGSASDHSVVMVIWDELPLATLLDADGGIDPVLFPNLARLADDGAWFRNATTVGTVTSIAVPAMLTGRYPTHGLAPVASDHPRNLFTLVAGSHQLRASEQITSLCPRALCSDLEEGRAGAGESPSGLSAMLGEAISLYETMLTDPGAEAAPQAFVEGVSPLDPDAVADALRDDVVGGAAPAYQVDGFENLLASIEPDEDPTLHFLHLQLPHTPYRFLPSGQAYQSEDFGGGMAVEGYGVRSEDEMALITDRQRLLLQTMFVDQLVGQLIERLEETGLYDDSIVVMTSDHGIGLEPGQPKRPLFDDEVPEEILADLLWVPLLIKAPGLEPGTVRDDNVMTVDVLPTVAELLGIELAWDVEGISLVSGQRDDETKYFHRVTEHEPDMSGFQVAIKPRRSLDGSAEFHRVLARNLSTLLRNTNPFHPLFDVVPGGELVGRSVEELGPGEASAVRFVFEDQRALTRYQPGARYVPVRVRGNVEGADEEPVTLAIVVDGVVAGVGRSREPIEGFSFDIMLSPDLVGPGEHTVDVFEIVVDEDEDAWALRPVIIG